jgi:hypothetical protein
VILLKRTEEIFSVANEWQSKLLIGFFGNFVERESSLERLYLSFNYKSNNVGFGQIKRRQ